MTATETNETVTVATAPKLFREEKRKVREKDLMVGVWYETDGTNKTAFVGKVLDLNDNELFSERVECEEFKDTDADAKLGYDGKALKKAKKAASEFATNFGKEPSERETVVADLKRLREALIAALPNVELTESIGEPLGEMLELIDKLAA